MIKRQFMGSHLIYSRAILLRISAIKEPPVKKQILSMCLAFIMLPVMQAHALDTSYNPEGKWWVNLGAGGGLLVSHTSSDDEAENDTGAVMYSGSINYALSDSRFLELRTTGTDDFLDLHCLFGCGEELDNLFEVGLLYGFMTKTEKYLAGASIGLAYTQLTYTKGEYVYVPDGDYYTTKYTNRHSSTVGIPVEIQLFLTPTKYFGIGLIGLGNVNPEGSVVGAMLALQFGDLR